MPESCGSTSRRDCQAGDAPRSERLFPLQRARAPVPADASPGQRRRPLTGRRSRLSPNRGRGLLGDRDAVTAAGGGGQRSRSDEGEARAGVFSTTTGQRLRISEYCANAIKSKQPPTANSIKYAAGLLGDGWSKVRPGNHQLLVLPVISPRFFQGGGERSIYIAAYALHYLRLIGSDEPSLEVKQPPRLSLAAAFSASHVNQERRPPCTPNPTFPAARPAVMVRN